MDDHRKSQSQKRKEKWVSDIHKIVDEVVIKLKRRVIRGSSSVAVQTAALLRTVISKGKFHTVKELMDMVRSVGKKLSAGHPIELAIGNIVRRVLFIIRHEVAVHVPKKDAEDGAEEERQVDMSLSLSKLLDKDSKTRAEEAKFSGPLVPVLKNQILEEITALIDEVKHTYTDIAGRAVEHIHARERIMTFGISRTVTHFLEAAAKLDRKFEVIVVESAPSYEGHKMAVDLAKTGIQATVITDSAVFGMMHTVSKVILGTHVVMANGGLILHTGGHNICAAAKHHSVPVVVTTGLYKLCPLYAFDQDTFNEHNAPSQILNFEDEYVAKVDVDNPGFDYIPPELVSLYITNFGGHNPSYIYRLISEYYNPADYTL